VKNVFLIVVALVPFHAQADTFSERLSSAQRFLESPEGRGYETWLNSQVGPLVTKTLQSCFGNLGAPDKSDFTVVADVLSSGKLSSVVARPATNLAQCFVRGLESATLSKPPGNRQRLPIYIEL